MVVRPSKVKKIIFSFVNIFVVVYVNPFYLFIRSKIMIWIFVTQMAVLRFFLFNMILLN